MVVLCVVLSQCMRIAFVSYGCCIRVVFVLSSACNLSCSRIELVLHKSSIRMVLLFQPYCNCVGVDLWLYCIWYFNSIVMDMYGV